MQKYSSNLVERCIEKSKKRLNKYIKEICESGRIGEVMKNHYGNYVIQKALKISEGEEKSILLKNVIKNINMLTNKKILLKWQSIVMPHIGSELKVSELFANNNVNYSISNKGDIVEQ